MKVAVLNYTGTVGKTTIAAHLLSPRMNNAPIFAIESINETAEGLGVDVEKMKGNKFRDLFKKIMLEDNAIIDIGASNIEEFMNNMIKFDHSHEEIDFFILPVTAGTKEQKESISMLDSLSAIGIPPNKIRVIFNRVDSNVLEEFPFIIGFCKKEKSFIANTKCAIWENELFDALSVKGLTVDALMKDETDYKSLLKSKTKASEKDRHHWADMFGLKALSKRVKRNLDDVYLELFNK
ncbi:plasmid stability protein StbB [Candidatus Williamhamiltonella defendens]|uniref:Plasmid stability protein StbB n=1 Tax=Candidatus Williamhamiltonella defendens TaxID=138072 RepID=A0A2D3T233_9ENTR|nr:StbB family protein [Candidatus Hamiltonella defensa]ATW29856.1 plasmid stability protein StbB [Candidatus Hamiltonella defensa]ATW31830.1 plasmid stability protein StbB [Candidatus Hamiltonella defensa]